MVIKAKRCLHHWSFSPYIFMTAFPLQQNICFPSLPLSSLKILRSVFLGFVILFVLGFFYICILGLQHSSLHQYQSLDGRVLWILRCTLTVNHELQIHFHVLMAKVFHSSLLVKANPGQVQSMSLVVLGALVGHLDINAFGELSAGSQVMYDKFCFSHLASADTRKENSWQKRFAPLELLPLARKPLIIFLLLN